MKAEVKAIVDAVNELTRQMYVDSERMNQLEVALLEMVNEKCDYMKINNLGDPETTHTVKLARAALAGDKK